MNQLPVPHDLLTQMPAKLIRIEKNLMDKIIDVRFMTENASAFKTAFVEYQWPNPTLTGTFEICRQMLSDEAGVKFCVRLNVLVKQDYIFESFITNQPPSNKFLVLKDFPVPVRYMRFFMQEHVNINFRNGELGPVELKNWDNDWMFQQFMAKMRAEERRLLEASDSQRRRNLRPMSSRIDQMKVLYEWTKDEPAYLRPDRN